ncbi:MAG: hypothetical protein GTN69_00865 [Armatimonadetes bacterium]|nr:hypothetical protein [Armatimonadota bacterium]NIO74458.1 hypothetical protein [Armatimonadota bacterium]NIT31333.1 hypothetical protein [Armatimonadota bacterium]
MLTLHSLPWKWILVSLVITAGLASLLRKGSREANTLSLSQGELKLPSWPREINGWQVLHLSDLHFRDGSDLPDRVMAIIQHTHPDCVIITGDLLAPGGKGRAEAKRFLQNVSARWPTFAVPGNKDALRDRMHVDRSELLDEWRSTEAKVLLNSAIPVSYQGKRIWIAGVDDPHTRKDDLAAALRDVPAGEPVVLLAHSPVVIKRDGIERASVIFSGHTHGGQICLPGGTPLYIHTSLPCRYSSGVHTVANGESLLVVTRGVGHTRLRLRLWCPPEMTLWRLQSIGE